MSADPVCSSGIEHDIEFDPVSDSESDNVGEAVCDDDMDGERDEVAVPLDKVSEVVVEADLVTELVNDFDADTEGVGADHVTVTSCDGVMRRLGVCSGDIVTSADWLRRDGLALLRDGLDEMVGLRVGALCEGVGELSNDAVEVRLSVELPVWDAVRVEDNDLVRLATTLFDVVVDKERVSADEYVVDRLVLMWLAVGSRVGEPVMLPEGLVRDKVVECVSEAS